MVLRTYVIYAGLPAHNGDIIRYEPIAAIVWKYVSMNEDTFIYETRYLCTGHGRCNILLLCVLTYLFVLSFSPPTFFSLRLFALVPARVLPTFGVHRSRGYYAIVSMYIISHVSCIFFYFS